MANANPKLEQVEQELESLRNQLITSFGVLESLAEIQGEFENLAQTYQKLQQYLEEVPGSLKELESRLNDIQQNFEGEVRQQVEPILQRGIDDKIAALLEDWNNQKEAIQASMQRLYQLDNWTQQASSTMTRLEGQVKFLRTIVFVVTAIVFIAIPVLFLMGG